MDDGPIALTGLALDRAGDGRRTDHGWVVAQGTDARARALTLSDAGVLGGPGGLDLRPLAEAAAKAAYEPVLLGIDSDGPLWAVDEGPEREGRAPMIGSGGRRGEPVARQEGWVGMREAVLAFGHEQAALAAYAAGLCNWHRNARRCPACGERASLAEAGFTRRCDACGLQHHPRVDPVAIMLVSDGERVILGRQRGWPQGRYSALAGFVGPGESLEDAVRREVGEEAGVEVGEVAYVASQPWPFPGSLMIGFIARWASGELGGSDPELEDVRWFGRAEVAAACERDDEWTGGSGDGTLLLPPRSAIARRLAERWLAG